MERNREGWRLLFGGGAAIAGSAADEALRLRFETVGRIAELLRPFLSVDQARLEMHAHAVSGAAEQLAKWWLANADTDRETVVDMLTGLLWAGFERSSALPAKATPRRRTARR